jgi:hypothetical protein
MHLLCSVLRVFLVYWAQKSDPSSSRLTSVVFVTSTAKGDVAVLGHEYSSLMCFA